MSKKIVFVTSTRADYGKLKSIILKLQNRISKQKFCNRNARMQIMEGQSVR